jgi:hypothetical protein
MDHIPRPDLGQIRKTLGALGAVVAEVDRDLRYVWIANPHPDFDPSQVLGRRDDQLIPPAEALPLMDLKRRTFEERRPLSHVLQFMRSDGQRSYSLLAYPVVDDDEQVRTIVTIGFDLPA